MAWKIMISSGHTFAHGTTAQLSWHVQNCDLVGSPLSKLEQNDFSQDSVASSLNNSSVQATITQSPLRGGNGQFPLQKEAII